MIQLVNDDAMTLDAGNALLETLHLPALPGGREFGFRVPVAIPALGERPSAVFRDAQAHIAPEVRSWRHTLLDGHHEGYGIEDLHERVDGRPLHLVHTDLFLTVTVGAHRAGEALSTAQALLTADLSGVDSFTVHTDRIGIWYEDTDEEEDDDLDDEDGPRMLA